MTPQFNDLVHPVIAYALDLKDRVDRGDAPDLDAEQRQLLERLRSDAEARRVSDYFGDGVVFLGARYALTCWLDELFIVHSRWSELWKERVLEYALFGSRDRAWKFWEQAEIALRRPNTPRVSPPPGPDALETFFLCVVLGFRGRYLENPAQVREILEEMRSQVARPGTWVGPRDLGMKTNVEPLAGTETLRRVLAIYGGVSLAVALGLLVVLRVTGFLGS
jgi:type VI secretion system protein ImpK